MYIWRALSRECCAATVQRSKHRKATGYPRAPPAEDGDNEDEDDSSKAGVDESCGKVDSFECCGEADGIINGGEVKAAVSNKAKSEEGGGPKKAGGERRGDGTRIIRFEDSGQPDDLQPVCVRRNVRKATGFPLAQPMELEEEDDDSEDDDKEEAPPEKDLKPNVVDSECRSASGSGGNDFKTKASSQQSVGVNATPSVSKAFLCFGLCGDADKNEIPVDEGGLLRRSSSVGIGEAVDIEDSDSDLHWRDQPRHTDRMERIRNRRPTGHPTKMKLSGEHMDMLHSLVPSDDQEGHGEDESILTRDVPTAATYTPPT
eukprot:GHVS01005345.1.p1 GENE.GHVS01005345.1~~GHVS01005345.1.p1  ORF type:complete len:316 (-),score=61.04 GHVS01005345.1:1058-2005(-)